MKRYFKYNYMYETSDNFLEKIINILSYIILFYIFGTCFFILYLFFTASSEQLKNEYMTDIFILFCSSLILLCIFICIKTSLKD